MKISITFLLNGGTHHPKISTEKSYGILSIKGNSKYN